MKTKQQSVVKMICDYIDQYKAAKAADDKYKCECIRYSLVPIAHAISSGYYIKEDTDRLKAAIFEVWHLMDEKYPYSCFLTAYNVLAQVGLYAWRKKFEDASPKGFCALPDCEPSTEIKPSVATRLCKYVLWTVAVWWVLLLLVAAFGLTIQLLIALTTL